MTFGPTLQFYKMDSNDKNNKSRLYQYRKIRRT